MNHFENAPPHFQSLSEHRHEMTRQLDILPAPKGEDSHGTAPLGWDV
jgi:hypothetical protein